MAVPTVTDNAPDAGTAPTPPAAPVPLWRNRDYILLWSGQIVSAVGSQMTLVALPLLVFHLTRSAVAMGWVAAFGGIPYVLLMLPAGALIDRWDRKRVMLLCDSLRALALLSIPAVALTGRLTIAQIGAVALACGTLHVFFSLAETSCLPRVVPPSQLAAASAQMQVIDSVAWLVGPALGGLLFTVAPSLPFFVDGVTYAASAASLLFITARFQGARAAGRVTAVTLAAEVREGLRFLWREPVLRVLALLTGGLMTPVAGFSLIVVIQAKRLHASDAAVGFVLAAGGVGFVLGALLATPIQRRFRYGIVVAGSAAIWALTWLPYAFAPNTFTLAAVNAAAFVVVPVYMAAQLSYRLAAIPDDLQGRVSSVFRLIAFGSQPLGVAITGLLAQAWGAPAAVVVLFIPQALCALVALRSRSLRGAVLGTTPAAYPV